MYLLIPGLWQVLGPVSFCFFLADKSLHNRLFTLSAKKHNNFSQSPQLSKQKTRLHKADKQATHENQSM